MRAANDKLKIKLSDKLSNSANTQLQHGITALALALEPLHQCDDLRLMAANHRLAKVMHIIVKLRALLGEEFQRVESLIRLEQVLSAIDDYLLSCAIIPRPSTALSAKSRTLLQQLQRCRHNLLTSGYNNAQPQQRENQTDDQHSSVSV